MASTIDILERALSYAELGLAIFPVHGITANGYCTCGDPECVNAGKHPRNGRGCLEATVNVTTIRGWFSRWPDSNIGLATGEISGVVVLDVDGSEGELSVAKKPSLPNTPASATGRAGGGTHYFFKWPGYRCKNLRKADGLDGLDFRGDGGYVVAAGSRHETGNMYKWICAPAGLKGFKDTAEFAAMPHWLEDILAKAGTSDYAEGDEPPIVSKGSRDVQLTSMAGAMRRKGMPKDIIQSALLDFNEKYCNPPLAETQVIKIANSVSRYRAQTVKINASIFDDDLGDIEISDIFRDARASDVGNAEVFTDTFGNVFRYDYIKKTWMVWIDGEGVWREDEEGISQRAMMMIVRLRSTAAVGIPDDAQRKTLTQFLLKTESQQGIPNSLKRAATMKGIPVDTNIFDLNPVLLNCANGTLNMDTGEFYVASADDMLSKQVPVMYDSTAECSRWEWFITEIFDGDCDLMSYFQRAIGYTLSGITKEQAIFVCHGNGANGKSTALNTIKRILGSYAAATPFDTFEADSRNQYGNDLAALKGKRYVVASESESTRRLAEARVKLITGNDPIACRFLYGEYFEYLPQFKVWLAVNHKPVIRGTDHGIWRRIHLLPFNVTFGPSGKPMDKDLENKLAEELPGILNWAISGYTYWKLNGLNPPESVVEATAEYKRENDYIASWLEDRVSSVEGSRMSATEAYADFREYMLSVGEVERGIPTMKGWSIAMAEKGFDKKRTAKGMEYLGLKLGVLKLSDRGN